MRANAVLAFLKDKEFQKCAVCFLVIGGVCAILTFFFIVQLRKVRSLRDELAQLEVKSRLYDDFDTIKDKISPQRDRIAHVLQSGAIDKLLVDTTDQGIFETLNRISGAAGIRLHKVAPIKNDNGPQLWGVGIKASYRNMVTFISLLEQSFKISKFKITSSRNTAIHSAELIICPVTIPAASGSPLSAGKGLLEMYVEIEASLKEIEAGLNPVGGNCRTFKDPLYFSDDCFRE